MGIEPAKAKGAVRRLMLAAGLLACGTLPAQAQEVVWDDGALKQSMIPGGEASVATDLTARKTIENAELLVQPAALKPFVELAKKSFPRIGAGASKTVTLNFAIPDSQPLGMIEGRIAVRGEVDGKTKVLAEKLPVKVNVVRPATLKLRTVQEDDPSAAGPAKTRIFLDGILLGRTKANGNLTAQVAPGPHRISAFIPFEAGAATTATLVSGKTKLVTLTPKGAGLNLVEDYDLVLAKLEKGILPADFASFTLQLKRPDGAVVKLDSLQSVGLTGIAPRSASDSLVGDPLSLRVDLTDLFQLVQKGRAIRAKDPDALRDILENLQNAENDPHEGTLQIAVMASNLAKGMTYYDFVTFQLGSFRLNGELRAPPSNPNLPVGGVPVRIDLFSSDVSFTVKSKADGSFAFPTALPAGTVYLSIAKKVGAKVFQAAGPVVMDADKTAFATLLALADLQPPSAVLQVTSSISALSARAAADRHELIAADAPARAEAAAARAEAPEEKGPAVLKPPAGPSVSVDVSGGFPENRTFFDLATLTVPAGVTEVTLTYEVDTDEYPGFVTRQSVFDDVWNVSVRDQTGKTLFDVNKSVNAQWKAVDPTWQADGSTGPIIETIKVPGPRGSQRKLTLIAQSTNVADNALPTRVQATLGTMPAPFDFRILLGSLNPLMSIPRVGDTVAGETKVNGDRVDKNVFQKSLKATVRLPGGYNVDDLTSVIVTFRVGASGSASNDGIIAKAGGIGGPVVRKAKNKFDTQVTLGGKNSRKSPLTNISPGIPPPATNIGYEMKVKALVDGKTVSKPVRWRPGVTALWRMPDRVPRYGVREEGGDDWVSAGAYRWILAHVFDVTRIDDLTGEHGRHLELGHKTHGRGTDIDIFHFGDELAVPDAGEPFSGNDNYKAARQLAVDALEGDGAAEASLKAWIEAQRAGAQKLIALENVALLICPLGAPDPGGLLPLGWFKTLFEAGTLKAQRGGAEIDIGGGLVDGKLVFDLGHNSHYHIALNGADLINFP